MFEKRIFGVAYYPELWEETVVDADILRMKALHINTVRIGEFAWSVMEPREGAFDFSFFQKIIRKFHENGIGVILGTPTPTPPVWMVYGHPERMFNDNGRTVNYGARQHVCTNNPYFRSRVRELVSRLAEACGSLPGLIGWQIDNELKCNVGECFCAECEKQWHLWLAEKYTSIDVLNERWGTGVWSQHYDSFEQVPVPRSSTCAHSPSLSTNYRLFSREKVTEFAVMQAELIRRYSDRPITHNSAFWFGVDYDTMAKHLDFASYDDYPFADNYRQPLFDNDRFRCVKPDVPFMCIETCPGFNGDITNSVRVHPRGYVAAEVAAAFAMGSSGFSFWHFRQHRSGSELPHGAILSASGEPTNCYEDVLNAANRLRELEPLLEATQLKPAQIALHYSDLAKAYMLSENYGELDYVALVRRFYDALEEVGYPRDVLPVEADPSGYRLVITPFIYHLDDSVIGRMLRFAENGGTWLIGPMTNIRTADHTVHTDAVLGQRLEEAAGVHVAYLTRTAGIGMEMEYCGRQTPLLGFAAVLRSKGAEILSETVGDYAPGEGVLSAYRCGKGRIMLLGAMPQGQEILQMLLKDAANTSGVDAPFIKSSGITGVARKDADGNEVILAIDMGGRGGSLTYGGQKMFVRPYAVETFTVPCDTAR